MAGREGPGVPRDVLPGAGEGGRKMDWPGGPCLRVRSRATPRGSLSKTDVLPWSDQVPWEPLGLPSEGGQRPGALLECSVSQVEGVFSTQSVRELFTHAVAPLFSSGEIKSSRVCQVADGACPRPGISWLLGYLFPTGVCLWSYDGHGEEQGPFTVTW